MVLKGQVKPEKVTRALDYQVLAQAPRSVEPTQLGPRARQLNRSDRPAETELVITVWL